MPSTRGIRRSISTRSGKCASTAAGTSSPSAACPTTEIPFAPSSIISRLARTNASSSTTSTRMVSCMAATVARRPAGTRHRAPARGPAVPPASCTRSVSPTSPVPLPGASGTSVRRRVRQLDPQPVARPGRPPARVTGCPAACLRAFVSPSCTTRYAVRPVAGGNDVGPSPGRRTRSSYQPPATRPPARADPRTSAAAAPRRHRLVAQDAGSPRGARRAPGVRRYGSHRPPWRASPATSPGDTRAHRRTSRAATTDVRVRRASRAPSWCARWSAPRRPGAPAPPRRDGHAPGATTSSCCRA